MAKITKKTVKKAVNLEAQSTDELKAELVSTQTELVEAKRSHASRELSNTMRISQLRKQIARIKTVLSHSLVNVSKEREKK